MLAAYTMRESWEKAQGMQVRITNPTIAYQNFSGPMTNARRLVIINHYFDEANRTVGLPFGGDLSLDQLFRGFEYTEPTTGEVLAFSGWGDPTGGARPTAAVPRLIPSLGHGRASSGRSGLF